LNERNDVPKRLANEWVATEQISPLLDGLDEVAPEHRRACVDSINMFRRDHGLLPMAVSSRLAEYEGLSLRLRLRHAVMVQPLTAPDILRSLRHIGEPGRSLAAAFQQDTVLAQLLETPLMLWLALLAYRDASVRLPAGALDEQRTRLFASFVNAMFTRRSPDSWYSRARTIRWLSWLASMMIHRNQSLFHLEDISESCLASPVQRLSARIIVAFITSLVTASLMLPGFIIGVSKTHPFNWFGFAVPVLGITGLAVLMPSLASLHPAERLRFNLTAIRSRAAERGKLRFSPITTILPFVCVLLASLLLLLTPWRGLSVRLSVYALNML